MCVCVCVCVCVCDLDVRMIMDFKNSTCSILFVLSYIQMNAKYIHEPPHMISNNVVCATSKTSDQTARMPLLVA